MHSIEIESAADLAYASYVIEHGMLPVSGAEQLQASGAIAERPMYNPKCWPYVDHYRGTELFLEHVEKYIGPTITSDQILGGAPFTFSGNPRLKTAKTE